MDKEQKDPKMNMPKFNMNWLYIIAICTLIFLYFSQGGTESSVKTTTSYENFKKMVLKGYASDIVVNNNEKTLLMYVKTEHIRDVFKQGVRQTGKNPCVEVEFGSVDKLETFIDQARSQKKFLGDFSYENKDSGDLMNIIINVLPFIFLVGIWIFFMRRMGGGGAGGGPHGHPLVPL